MSTKGQGKGNDDRKKGNDDRKKNNDDKEKQPKKPPTTPSKENDKLPIDAQCRICRRLGIAAFHHMRNCPNRSF